MPEPWSYAGGWADASPRPVLWDSAIFTTAKGIGRRPAELTEQLMRVAQSTQILLPLFLLTGWEQRTRTGAGS
jgi:hypothetical protein